MPGQTKETLAMAAKLQKVTDQRMKDMHQGQIVTTPSPTYTSAPVKKVKKSK